MMALLPLFALAATALAAPPMADDGSNYGSNYDSDMADDGGDYGSEAEVSDVKWLILIKSDLGQDFSNLTMSRAAEV